MFLEVAEVKIMHYISKLCICARNERSSKNFMNTVRVNSNKNISLIRYFHFMLSSVMLAQLMKWIREKGRNSVFSALKSKSEFHWVELR